MAEWKALTNIGLIERSTSPKIRSLDFGGGRRGYDFSRQQGVGNNETLHEATKNHPKTPWPEHIKAEGG
jgi:hypothetical protein